MHVIALLMLMLATVAFLLSSMAPGRGEQRIAVRVKRRR